jgi:hypothetical protein
MPEAYRDGRAATRIGLLIHHSQVGLELVDACAQALHLSFRSAGREALYPLAER